MAVQQWSPWHFHPCHLLLNYYSPCGSKASHPRIGPVSHPLYQVPPLVCSRRATTTCYRVRFFFFCLFFFKSTRCDRTTVAMPLLYTKAPLLPPPHLILAPTCSPLPPPTIATSTSHLAYHSDKFFLFIFLLPSYAPCHITVSTLPFSLPMPSLWRLPMHLNKELPGVESDVCSASPALPATTQSHNDDNSTGLSRWWWG